MLEADGPGLVADGFDERSDAEVLDGAEAALGDPEDEIDGIRWRGAGRRQWSMGPHGFIL